MSLDRIYKILTADAQWDDLNPKPPQSVEIATNAPDEAYLVGSGGFIDWDALTSTIVGSWDSETGLQEGQSYDNGNVIGTPTHPVTADYTGWIRPLGNKDRWATGVLDSTRWAGHSEQKFLQDDERYTNTDSPFFINIVRDDNRVGPLWDSGVAYNENDKVTWDDKGWNSTANANLNNEPGTSPPRWEEIESGYGWTATMLKASTSRPSIVNYKVGIYPDDTMTPGAEIYFTGAFQDMGGSVFQSSAPAGQWTLNPDDVYYSLIFSPGPDAQEGIFSMLVGQNDVSAEFWSHDQ
jgi:hypothetical protein